MGEDLAATNVNRSHALAATKIAIFTFMLFFLYPRFENGRINPGLSARCGGPFRGNSDGIMGPRSLLDL
jgi:hypothetical protein